MSRENKEFAITEMDGPNGKFFRILERANNGPWLMAVGSIDWNTEQDAKYWIAKMEQQKCVLR